MADVVHQDLQVHSQPATSRFWPYDVRKAAGVESYTRNVATVTGCRELRHLAVIVEPGRESWKSTTFRAAPLWALGATKVITEDTKAVWLVKPLISSLEKVVYQQANGRMVFWDYLDSYPTASPIDPEQCVPQRANKKVVFVGCTPLACELSAYRDVVCIPHHGDDRFDGCLYSPLAKLGYHGESGYIKDVSVRLDALGVEVDYQPLGTTKKPLQLAGLLSVRGGKFATAANAALKPQMKFANAIIADVPFLTSDVAAARSLAEYHGLSWNTISLKDLRDAVRSHTASKPSLYVITGTL